jgi:flagellar basal-body rod protein FlgB
MDIAGIELFRTAGKRLEYLAQRHRVVAENVVNANTPGYAARDLKPFDTVMNGIKPVTPVRTDAKHLVAGRAGDVAQEAHRPDTWEMTPDGNGVALEQEMIKASDTREAYSLVSGIFQKHVAMLRTAWSARG